MQLLRSYVRKHRGLLVRTLVLATINQVFSLLDPQLFRMIVDTYISNYKDFTTEEFIRGVGLLLLGMIGVAMVSRLAKNFQDYYVNVMAEKVGMEMYQNTIRHAFRLPYKIFEDTQSGQLLQKLQKARTDIQNFIKTSIDVVFLSSITLLFVIIYAFMVHRIIALLFFLLIPIMSLSMYMMSEKIRTAQKDIVSETSLLAGATTETIRNISLIKSMGLENQEMDRLEITNNKILGLELKKITFLRSLEFVQGTLINAMRVIIMAVMFWLVYIEAVTLGEFFSLFFYSFFVFQPLRLAGDVIKRYQEAKASSELVEEFLAQSPDEVPQKTQSIATIESCEFASTSFGYNHDKLVLHTISYTVKKGETIAFVGPSGSGKSTILKLLVGLYKPTSGSVRINDIQIHDIDIAMYKNRIGIVAQDTQLFSGTIKENLLFVKPDASDALCYKVLEQAQISDLINSNTDGLNVKIGEGGLKLSGGQRQRLAIARALLRNPDMLIFDEATSSLDSLIEAEITETVKNIIKKQPDLITILVAHRLSTIMHADRIYVLENGSIVEQGTHEQLSLVGCLYTALRRQQSGKNHKVLS